MIRKLHMVYPLAVVMFFVVVMSELSAFAGPASDSIKQTHEEILQVLHDRDLKDPARSAERQQQLALLIAQRFSCREMARYLLGQRWNPLEEEEKAEFVRLFLLMLVKSYVEYVDRYADQPIQYFYERSYEGRAVVPTRLVGESREVLLDFWLFERSGEWQVYDVVIDGVSLVENYRAQFKRLLRVSSYENLVEKMRQKVCQGCSER